MGVVYHGSKEHGLTRLEPRKSTHGKYVYATPEKVLAVHFSGRCGDDLTYDLGHFDSDRNGPWELVENIPGAFEKMYSNSSSIYTLSDETFVDMHTGFREVLSEEGVSVQSEELCPNVYEAIMQLEHEGLLKIYRYPNKPESFKRDGSDILDKMRHYKYDMGAKFNYHQFDRLAYLHPSLLPQINELAVEFGIDVHYEIVDLIDLFRDRVQRQLRNPDHEQFIDSSYISICRAYPELKPFVEEIYKNYLEEMAKRTSKGKNI